MRLARTGIQLALVLSALALSAPSAVAAPAGDVRVNPGKAVPGSTVTVSTTACGKETYGKGESVAGGKFHLLPGDREGVLVGRFTLPLDAASGTDTVTLKCPPRILKTVTYQISGRPNGAVEAGFGWAAGPEEGGGDSPYALGALLLGGAAAGVVVTMRRRATAARNSV
ncbi:sortase [Streptomyces sp. TX20-6-3]|uniref:sortase n=1 Tax=Streptomyces sp. TX20-6-3 TaxID=3028705 RepID=UPI0029A59CA8|nr:sortase [Streptomyces sp. TX20-6-3]MDX2562862.1 sortase [Streptomyces sp. TX20-6-3]